MATSEVVVGPPAQIPARSSSIFDLYQRHQHQRSKSNPLEASSPPTYNPHRRPSTPSHSSQDLESTRFNSHRKTYQPDSVVNGILSDLNGASPAPTTPKRRGPRQISPPRRSSMINDTPRSVWWKPAGMDGEPRPEKPYIADRPPSWNPGNMDEVDDALIFGSPPSWTTAQEKILAGPFDYLLSHPGKDIRSQLIAAFNAWLKVPSPSLQIVDKVVGMLHTASLLVDDVEDNSVLRRGVPVAHNIFGVAQTINSANYIYFLALAELQKLNNPKVLAVFTEEMVSLHRGQGLDLFWRDSLTCPTEAEYLEMVSNKTGGLLRLAVKLMQAESSCPTDFVPLVNLIGIIFQIRDDFMNLWSSDYSKNKGMCEDLSEGKFSFPIIHAIRADLANLHLLNILKQKTQDEAVKKYAVDYMEKVGSFAYTRRRLQGLEARAKEMIKEVGNGNGEGKAVLAVLDKLHLE